MVTVNDTTYSKMVGDFVNDAKNLVENSWDWSGLRQTLTVPTVQGQRAYSLDGSGNRIKALLVINDTSDYVMSYQTTKWFDEQYLTSTVGQGSPSYYTFEGTDANGDTKAEVFPPPDGVYNIDFKVVLRPDELQADSDELLVPWEPVVHLAVAMLARERGETGGTSTVEYFSIADKFLSDAIALDAARQPEETIWYTP